jgi:diacylglycerol O-acyltransferase / trehalose O-mycolyltransferase
MGGLGAMAYAARHPGMFRAAASYSGNLHTRYLGTPLSGYELPQGLLSALHEDPNAVWGDPFRQGDIWAAHNPYDLAPKLRGTRLFVSFGDGQPGPHDTDTDAQELEQILYPQNTAFVKRLHQLGIPGHGRRLQPRDPRVALLAAGAAPVPATAAGRPAAALVSQPQPPTR